MTEIIEPIPLAIDDDPAGELHRRVRAGMKTGLSAEAAIRAVVAGDARLARIYAGAAQVTAAVTEELVTRRNE